MKQILCILALIFLLSSCKNSKETLGLTENIPDELQATKTKPLEIPPHFNHSQVVRTAIQKSSQEGFTPAEEVVIHEIDKK